MALALLLPLAGCQSPAPEQAPAQPMAAVITDLRPGTPLEDMLQNLDQELVRAMAGGMEGPAVDHFRRAEAISDRLLEARQPFEWLSSDQYSVQARLRQIQSGTDRVSAQLQTGAPRDSMLLDLRELRKDVLRLRQAISRGGGRAPTPLEQLMADTTGSSVPRPAPTTPAAAPAAAQSRPDTLRGATAVR